MVVQNTVTKQWDIYGVVTAISPHCWYFVKTLSGQVLVTNRRYLRISMYDVLLEKASDSQTTARLLALACPESGAWLNALLIAALGLCLSDDVVRTAVGLRLGASLCRPHICSCCGATVSGHMALSCSFSKGHHSHRASLNDVIKRGLQSAGNPSHLEPDGKQPDGATVVPIAGW